MFKITKLIHLIQNFLRVGRVIITKNSNRLSIGHTVNAQGILTVSRRLVTYLVVLTSRGSGMNDCVCSVLNEWVKKWMKCTVTQREDPKSNQIPAIYRFSTTCCSSTYHSPRIALWTIHWWRQYTAHCTNSLVISRVALRFYFDFLLLSDSVLVEPLQLTVEKLLTGLK